MKTITTKRAMTSIVKNLEKKLNESLSIYTGREFKVIRNDYNDTIQINIYDNKDCELSSPCLETIQEIVRPYEKKYEGMFYNLAAYPYKYRDNEFYYTPCVQIWVRMKSN